MRLVGMAVVHEFLKKHGDVQDQVEAWATEVREASWQTPADIKARYASASILSENRVVFNLKGNKYRLLAKVSYKLQIVVINKIGTHADYDNWAL